MKKKYGIAEFFCNLAGMRVKKRNSYLTLFLGVQVLLVMWIKKYPSFVEVYYSEGVYPYISMSLRNLLGWIPFSIGDLLVIFFVGYCNYYIFLFLKTKFKNLHVRVIEITALISVAHLCFYLFWGFNYFREPLHKKLGYKNTYYSNKELIRLSNYLVLNLNRVHQEITQSDSVQVMVPHSNGEMFLLAKEGYESLALKFPEFKYKYGKAKNSLMSLVQSYIGTQGYINPFTGEAHVNRRIPRTSFPLSACHEMAHQIGYAAENEANFIGFLAALSNKDSYFTYSAYRMATRYAIYELYTRDREEYLKILQKINKGVLKDFKASTDFWKSYSNPFEPLIKKGYDTYLKTNKQTEGLNSYNQVVNLLINYLKSSEPRS